MVLLQYPYLNSIQDIARQRKVDIHLVGGFLRDYVLKRENQDLDFAVSKDSLKFAEVLAEHIKGAYIVLDKDNGCARVAKKIKGVLYTYDFADFRGKDIQSDLSSRDFTINTLSVDLMAVKDDTVIDDVLTDVKRGLKDISSQRIKRTSIRAFKDDPLRMMRAFSLKAMLGFRIELSTLNQIAKEKDLIRNVSSERICEELFKILNSDRTAEVLRQMDKIGFLEAIIPQIKVMYNCTQGQYHHLDVWKHTLEAVTQVEKIFYAFREDQDIQDYLNETISAAHTRKALIKFGLLLHDIGKPDTRKKKEEGGFSFHGHEHAGRDIAHHVARQLKMSTKERHILEDLVQYHLRPGYLSNFKKPSERMYFRYLRDTKDEAASIALLSLADQRATRGPLTTEEDQKHHEKICRSVIRRYFEKKKEKPFVRVINGTDLLKKFKVKPSSKIGEALAFVEELQVLGKISTKTEAYEAAEKFFK